jgi:hypothetical protein
VTTKEEIKTVKELLNLIDDTLKVADIQLKKQQRKKKLRKIRNETKRKNSK